MPPDAQPKVFAAAVQFARQSHPLNKTVVPNKSYTPRGLIELGSYAHSTLTRYLQPSHIAMLLCASLDDNRRRALPLDHVINPNGGPATLHTLQDHVVAALGGAVVAVAVGETEAEDRARTMLERVSDGIAEGLSAFAELIEAQGAIMTGHSKTLRRTFEKGVPPPLTPDAPANGA